MDPNQILQLDIYAAFAEYESNTISRRTREGVYSAMVNSGKFNATRPVLGLDPLIVNGARQVGFYSRNEEEIRSVEWIMRTFIKYGSYMKTLEECKRRGVLTKRGNQFSRHSLHTLLTNQIYQGKWELNSKNKEKNQGKLMPYEKYAVIDLPLGPLIEEKLWNSVQASVAKITGAKSKSTCVRKIYPLSGLLKLQVDGSSFGGTGNWGKTKRCFYYYNRIHNFRIPCKILEEAAAVVVGEIVSKSPKLQSSIKKFGSQIEQTAYLLSNELERLELEISDLKEERSRLNKRLDFLIGSEDESKEAELFREEYRQEVSRIKEEIARRTKSLDIIKTQRTKVKNNSFSWRELGDRSVEIQQYLTEDDPVALRNAYSELFERIEVGDLDKNGIRKVTFVLKGCADSHLNSQQGKFVMAADAENVLGKEWGG